MVFQGKTHRAKGFAEKQIYYEDPASVLYIVSLCLLCSDEEKHNIVRY